MALYTTLLLKRVPPNVNQTFGQTEPSQTTKMNIKAPNSSQTIVHKMVTISPYCVDYYSSKFCKNNDQD